MVWFDFLSLIYNYAFVLLTVQFVRIKWRLALRLKQTPRRKKWVHYTVEKSPKIKGRHKLLVVGAKARMASALYGRCLWKSRARLGRLLSSQTCLLLLLLLVQLLAVSAWQRRRSVDWQLWMFVRLSSTSPSRSCKARVVQRWPAAARLTCRSRVVSATNCAAGPARPGPARCCTAARLMMLLQCLVMTGVCCCLARRSVARPCNLHAQPPSQPVSSFVVSMSSHAVSVMRQDTAHLARTLHTAQLFGVQFKSFCLSIH